MAGNAFILAGGVSRGAYHRDTDRALRGREPRTGRIKGAGP